MKTQDDTRTGSLITSLVILLFNGGKTDGWDNVGAADDGIDTDFFEWNTDRKNFIDFEVYFERSIENKFVDGGNDECWMNETGIVTDTDGIE